MIDQGDLMKCKMKEKRPVLKRSVSILLTKNPVLQIRTGRPVETEEIQARSSEDSKSLNVEQTHDRTGRLVTDTAAVSDDSQIYHEANTLNVDEEVLRKRMEKSIAVYDENHEPMMVNEADMDFQNSRTTTLHCETRAQYQRSRIDSEN